ncbi:hypothetical protein EVAR_50483_1 [Eumeta japonica]|uniref:Uncharacterized protein n=1 Tax=Eumeta variegata TaxID=151549 RepID=A0A4C1XT41_EUMVA|nr:hypothetical protein EVAR_50483_1 [Eumeta japonica]
MGDRVRKFECSGRWNHPEEERDQPAAEPVKCNDNGVLFRTTPVEEYPSSTSYTIPTLGMRKLVALGLRLIADVAYAAPPLDHSPHYFKNNMSATYKYFNV